MFGPASVSTDKARAMRDTSTRPEGAIGSVGKPVIGGRVLGWEPNARLAGPQALMAAYAKAERNPGVAAGWGCARGLALSARWDVTAADDSELAQAAASHVRENLGIGRARSPLGRSWERLLAEFLTAHLYGFGLWELTTSTLPEMPDRAWTRLMYRHPGSVQAWLVDDLESLVGVTQGGRHLRGQVDIPVSRLLYIARDAHGTNFEGVGLLRAIEPLTRDNTATFQSLMAAIQRWSVGTPDVVLDREAFKRATGGSDDDFVREAQRWDDIAAKYVSFERNRFVREPWVSLGVYGGGGELATAPFESVVNLQQRLILTAFLAQFLQLGASGSGGSYSLGQVQADVAVQAAENLLEAVRDDLNTSLIPRMVQWSGVGDVPSELLPTLTFTGLRAPLWVQHIAELPALFAALGTPQTAVEVEILRELGFQADAVDRSPAERLRGIVAGARPAPGTVPPGPTVIRSAP